MKTQQGPKVKFSKNGELYLELKAYVDYYFAENKIKRTGNFALHIKALIISTLFVSTYCAIVFIQIPPPILLIWKIFYYISLGALLGFWCALVGFNIFHDAAHGVFSSIKWVNKVVAILSSYLLGGSSYIWNSKHNIAHHTNTNIKNHEEDPRFPFTRIYPSDELKKHHRSQHIYAFFLYLATSLATFVGDFIKLKRMRVSNTPIKADRGELIIFWVFKSLYVFLFLFLPIYLNGWFGVVGFISMHLVFGSSMANVFQLAHLVPKTEFVDDTPPLTKIDDEWMVHQLKTTCDFARGNKVISWLLGGLNYQVEHHLFTNISHVHYPEVSRIVRKFCKRNGLVFNKYITMWDAIKAHWRYLYDKGHYA